MFRVEAKAHNRKADVRFLGCKSDRSQRGNASHSNEWLQIAVLSGMPAAILAAQTIKAAITSAKLPFKPRLPIGSQRNLHDHDLIASCTVV